VKQLRVGELAKRTGLTVRTLHHYDEIGLLAPSKRTAAGYRLYGARDVARLQQIVSLRQLGLSLEEIAAFLKRPDASARRVVGMLVTRMRERIERQRELLALLERLEGEWMADREPTIDEFIYSIEAMTMYEKYYTPEQRAQLEERRKTIGDERIREVEQAWPKLIAEVRAEVEKGTDPSSERARELAARWISLVAEFTGGDAGIAKSLGRMYRAEPELRERTGIEPAMMEFIGKARAASD
jgi:DNA-binding transcriptional MerR regulator